MRHVLPIVSCLLWLSCGLEELVGGEITRGQQLEQPKAADNILEGRVASDLNGAQIAFFTGAGEVLEGLAGAADSASGVFTAIAPGNTAFSNLVVVATKTQGATPSSKAAAKNALGFVPEVARQLSVLDPPRILTLDSLQPGQTELGATSTTATLLLLAKARSQNLTLAVVSPSTARAAFSEIVALLESDARVQALASMVTRISTAETPVAAFRFAPDGQSWLDPAAIGTGLDYVGDDAAPETSTELFDAALAAALGAFEFNACYPPGLIRLVLIADLRPGGVDRNCTPIERFRWAKEEAGKQLFVTGSIHEDTPRCDKAPPPCLDGEVLDAASQLLGNWVPNKVAMYDDGSHGDAVSGDGLWTLALDLPHLASEVADAALVRIGYKYTYGFPSKGWTGAEEWPGNKRVLELRDQNGDRLIVRQDRFGDETTNKDKANLLSPAKGGCGSVLFPSDHPKPTCTNDVFESLVDSDNDCEPDAWPAPGTVGPLTIECPK